jgi:glycerate 2-kinase
MDNRRIAISIFLTGFDYVEADKIANNNILPFHLIVEKCRIFGYQPEIFTDTPSGDVNVIAEYIAIKIRELFNERTGEKICLLFNGKPYGSITGEELGGRNQHLALLVAGLIKDLHGITFLSGVTDGKDGHTDAAGAVIDTNTYIRASELHLHVEEYVRKFGSYEFFKEEGGLIITGRNHTSPIDLMICLIN